MKQYEAVIEALKKLGGIATLGQLNQEVFKIEGCSWNTKTPFASIRRIVQERKEIYRVRPGLWALKSFQHNLEANGIVIETDKNYDSHEISEFNHSYYQGLLLYIGNMKKLHTYVPMQDKNKKCINAKLGDICTENKIPLFSYRELVHRSSTIDVIWFEDSSIGNNLAMPHSFFEIEHSTDIQNSLLKYSDLQAFNVKMLIVADKKREDEFKRKLSYSAFKSLKENGRVRFLDYDKLVKLYEEEVRLHDINYSL